MKAIRERLAKLEAVNDAGHAYPDLIEFVCETDGDVYGVELPRPGEIMGRSYRRQMDEAEFLELLETMQ